MRLYRKLFLSLQLLQPLGGFIGVEDIEAAAIHQPKTILVPGPNGIELHFSGLNQGLYRHADVFRNGKRTVSIDVSNYEYNIVTLFGGAGAAANNGVRPSERKPGINWSLDLWSLDGSYVVLNTFDMTDGKLDIRNSHSKQAYSTLTGKGVNFVGPDGYLSENSFEKWSPTKPDVAILRGGLRSHGQFEEATPQLKP